MVAAEAGRGGQSRHGLSDRVGGDDVATTHGKHPAVDARCDGSETVAAGETGQTSGRSRSTTCSPAPETAGVRDEAIATLGR